MAETWETLFASGRYGEALQEFSAVRKTRKLTIEEAMAECEILDESSSSDLARDRAEVLARKADSRRDIAARAMAVLGCQHFRMSRLDEGRLAFVEAKAAARDSGNKLVTAGVQTAYLRALTSWVGPEAGGSELSLTKALVTPIGDSQLSARVKLATAELEIKRGLLSQGARQLQSAECILERNKHTALESECWLKRAVISLLRSNLHRSIAESQEAIRLAKSCSSTSLEVVARTNLGHVYMVMGRKPESESQLRTAAKMCRSGGGAELGILDGLALHCYEFGQPDQTERLMDEAWSLSSRLNDGFSYYGLWHVLTRARWLQRCGRTGEALNLTELSLPHAERLADLNLVERMRMLSAELLGACGRPLDGANLLAITQAQNPDPSLEMVAEASRIAGTLAADDAAAARGHYERALRIFHAIGHQTACRQTRRLAGFGDHGDTPRPTTRPAGRPAATTPARVVERAAAITHLAGHAPLIGLEVLDLLVEARACAHASLVEEDTTGHRRTIAARPPQAAEPGPLSPYGTQIALGALGSRQYGLRVEPCPTPSARTTVMAVERLAQASVALSLLRRDARERATLWPEPTPEEELGLVCASEAMQALVKTTRRIAPTTVPVLITGETGAGKEVFARALHQAGTRRDQVFLPFNCTTVPRDMLDAQLFGFRRGAFTGAIDEYAGLIRGAAGGTLFLDEIGEMPLDVQPKLLRFLESSEVLPLGESRPIHVDVRIVAATNADLDELVSAGRFREDLYYRLNVVRLRVPPLRERREEVPLLVQALLERYARESQAEPIRFSEEAMEFLALYDWPGNARQLGNELRRLAALAEPGAVIMPEHLSPDIAVRRTPAAAERLAGEGELVVRTDQPLAAATEHVERVLIAQALEACQGNLERAAQSLGLSRKGLFLKRQRLGMVVESARK